MSHFHRTLSQEKSCEILSAYFDVLSMLNLCSQFQNEPEKKVILRESLYYRNK